MSTLKEEKNPLPPLDALNDFDVPKGSGGPINEFLLRKYRPLIAAYKKEYQNCDKKHKKPLAELIVRKIQENGGSFLQSNNGKWEKISDEDAIEKVQQALREKKPDKAAIEKVQQALREKDDTEEEDEELKEIHENHDDSSSSGNSSESDMKPKAVSHTEMKSQIENWSKRLDGYQHQAEDINTIVDKLTEKCQALVLENERLKHENDALIRENQRLKGEDF